MISRVLPWCQFVCLLIGGSLQAQSPILKTLDHSDFLIWNTLQQAQLSPDGSFASYRIVPGEGDPALMIYDSRDSSTMRIPRVSKSQFDYDANILFGLITPSRDTLRSLERKKKDKKEWPCDTLFIRMAPSTSNANAEMAVQKIPFVTGYKSPAKYGDWLAYTIKAEALKKQTPEKDTVTSDTTKTDKPVKAEPKKKSKKEIVHLIIRQLSTGAEDTLQNVKEYAWAEKSPVLLAVAQSEDSTQTAGVVVWKNHQWTYLKKEKGEYAKISLAQDGTQLAFLGNVDTTKAQVPPWQLYYYDFKGDSATLIASKNESDYPLVSQHADPRWSEDGRYLFYGRAEMPIIRDTTLLPDETVSVEVWTTSDKKLYTIQKHDKPEEEKRSYAYVYDTQSRKHTAIGSKQWESVAYTPDRKGRFALVYTDQPYQLLETWMSDAPKNLAIVDLQTGVVKPFRQTIYTNPRMSPDGKFAYGYSDADSTWWTYHIVTGIYSLMNTKELPLFYDELHDAPGFPNSYGTAGWTKEDQSLILNDRYDLWSWSPLKGKTPVRITRGRETQMEYRYIRTDPEERSLSLTEPWLMLATDDRTKSSGYAWYNPVTLTSSIVQTEPFQYSRAVTQSRKADTYIFQKENFSVFPDLQLTRDRFAISTRISDVNPQQKEYAWGTIELYHWMDWDSVMRTGLLVKPAGFDTLHSYPTIVNFYERSSDDLHNHPTPIPHRSTINYAFYASRGYVVFNPDIEYEIGKPGESAYKIVMSGVSSLVKKRIVDGQNMALQGHSWGGYQIAYIVTRTNQFKCAEAGAAVVNMTSAYGGIRWESGRARLFQYEKEQSRLGKTLWEDPQMYIANSPLFKVDKIETPLLLMHNDEDGAVPFEQGIEFYLALRRNAKTAWLLNYTGEPHWPQPWEKRKDFQLRMSQFFDHYLKGAPMPEWMEKGVPAIEVGKSRQ